jgi:hypothetical protein
VSEGKAEEALQSAVCNASQTLALGLGFGRFESWRETHETCKNADNAARDAGKKARPVSRLAGMGAKSYISVSGDRQCRCWLLAASCCYEVVLAPAVSVRHTTPHLTSPGLQIPGMQRFLVKPLPQILSDVG